MPKKRGRPSRGASSRGSPARRGGRNQFSGNQRANQPTQEFNTNSRQRHIGFSMREEASYTGSHLGRSNIRHLDQIVFVSAGYMTPDEIFKAHPLPTEPEENDPNNLVVPHTHIEYLEDMDMEDVGDEEGDEDEKDEEDVVKEGGEEGEANAEAEEQRQNTKASHNDPTTTGVDSGHRKVAVESTTNTTKSITTEENGSKFVIETSKKSTVTMSLQTAADDGALPKNQAREASPALSDSSEEICFVPRNRRNLGQPQIAPSAPAKQEQKTAVPEAQALPSSQGVKKQQVPVQSTPVAPEQTSGSKDTMQAFSKPMLNPAATEFKATPIVSEPSGQEPASTQEMWDYSQYNYQNPQTYSYYSAEDYIRFQPEGQANARGQPEDESDEQAILRDYMENVTMNTDGDDEEAYGAFHQRSLGFDDALDFHMEDATAPRSNQATSNDLMHLIRGLTQPKNAGPSADTAPETISTAFKKPEPPKPKKGRPALFSSAEEEYLFRYENESAENSDVDGEIEEIIDQRTRNGEIQYLVRYETNAPESESLSTYWISSSKLSGEDKDKADEFSRMRAEYGSYVDEGMKSRLKDAEEAEAADAMEEDDIEDETDSDEDEDEDDYEDEDEVDPDALDSDEERELQEDEDYLLAMKIAEEENFHNAMADEYAARFGDDDDFDDFDEDLHDFLSFRPNKKTGAYPSASRAAAHFDGFEGFDIMDRSRASIQAGKPKKKSKKMPQFDISDEETLMKLTSQWENDRQKKKARKEERLKNKQIKHRAPPQFANASNLRYKLNNWYLDEDEIDIAAEILEFMLGDMDVLLFPPVSQYKRKLLHQLASDLNLQSKSIGSGENRAPTLRKVNSKQRALKDFEIRATMSQRKFHQLFKNSNMVESAAANKLYRIRKFEMKMAKSGRSTPGVHNKPGTVVGSDAPEIASDNKGRKMLEKMGYKTGMGLGAEGGGITAPIEAVVRGGRWGLG